MKSLLNIQRDIRKLESSVQDLANSIKDILSDIESLRHSSEGAIIDFSKIEILAKQISFGKHPLARLKEERYRQVYLEMLLNIVRLDPEQEMTINRMVFIQWLQVQSQIGWSLEDLYKDCFKINKQSYHELIDEIPQKYRGHFIVDALIVANIVGTASQEIHEYIADLVAILGVKTEKIRGLALISRVALCQSVAGLDSNQIETVQTYAKTYRHYIKPPRVIAVELPDSDVSVLKWKVKQQQKVNAGDVIVTYRKKSQTSPRSKSKTGLKSKPEEIKAAITGTIFQFRYNKTHYGVIAHEADNKDSIKSWVIGLNK